MKVTQILYKQNIGRQIRALWYIQGKRTPMETPAEKHLLARGKNIVDSNEVVTPKRQKIDFRKFSFLKTRPIPEDENHPDWHERQCLHYMDNELLVEGLLQAQLLTKTAVFDNDLPDSVENLTKELPEENHEVVQRIIKSSVIFDAQQEPLPIVKDQKRPAWVFPRQYGITDVRKVSNICKNLLQLCDCLSGPEIANARSILDDALISFPIEREFDLLKYLLTMDIVLMSEKPLRQAGIVNKNDHEDLELPSIYPLHPTAGLTKKNLYKLENLYPITSGYHKKNMHTIFINYDKTKVKNLTELEVTETQVFGRAMMKAFTAAASTARQKFGSDVVDLPEPVTIQCVHSDGKAFYFSVYQLNTLNLDSEEGLKNYCWLLPKLDLYETGGYKDGKPVLERYNPEVFERILAFYKNN